MTTNQQIKPRSQTKKSSLTLILARMGKLTGVQWLRKNALALVAAPLAVTASLMALSSTTAPNIAVLPLSADPLYAAAGGDKPALVLALSVEFPTVGAQYVDVPRNTSDGSYSNTKEYLGYYDAESCYTYNNAPTETPVAPLTASDYKRFDRSGPAIALTVADAAQPTRTSRKCANAFSGNFLNWASSSAIDMMRLALTGGDRYVDTSALTILQRAVIPNGDPMCMWNSSNFPGKQLSRGDGTSGSYFFGAVPTAMQTAAGTNDIWVANTLNGIYFGTSMAGGCGSTGDYTLTSSAWRIGTITSINISLPSSGMTPCANEHGICDGFTGTKEIWYGAGESWKVAPATGKVPCTNAIFGDPIAGTGKNCYRRNYSGTWTPPTTPPAGALNSDNYFFSRVQVCNTDSAGELLDVRDYGFCKKYPNGNYKPAGTIQKYSDQLRLAAFGYLMDQTASYDSGRYGGVLRAPMKYVGNSTYDQDGVENTATTGNPTREWETSTGVFLPNPHNDASNLSGVITYLNRFGRTGPTPGRYKRYDPVGELHYESLRYLQGLQPTPAAVSNIDAEMYDGFPAFTTWPDDPYGGTRSNTADYSCLKSNIVVIGDINTHDGNRLPTASAANNIPDINAWRTVVQNFEKNISSTYIDGQGASRTTSNPNGANGSVPDGQIMGSAYWAHTHDIRGTSWTGNTAKQRPGLRVKTFVFDVNEYADQNNATTRRTANQFFMAAKYGGFETDPSNLGGNPYNTKGNPFYRDNLSTADNYVWADTDPRASRAGEANTYFLQSDARGVLTAFDDIFSRASTAARSIAGGAIQSKELTTTVGNMVYQGAFDTSDWSGDLLAVPLTVSTSNVVSVSGTPSWSAATQLAALTTPATSRNIVVGKRSVISTDTTAATAFTWATIEDSLETSLNKLSPSATADTLGEARLNYLRGDRTREGSPFRRRNKLLGDIINSGVVYSGAPTTSISSSSYAAFYAAQVAAAGPDGHAARTPAVFVGANDGMLHAFNATTGDELFAYIPSWLGPKLAALTSPTYITAHQSYVDSSPTVAEAQTGTAGTAADWKTVLVSGTGGGGQGVFALDVTDPTAFSSSKVMWEFTNNNDPDMGFVMGKPQILKMRTSASSATTATYKWFAVVASGVNNYSVANSAGQFGSGHPALFLLDLSKAVGTSWALGTNYYKVSLPIDDTFSVTRATGLINFQFALGAAREVAQIYMGDLHGNLWKLDFARVGSTDWNMNTLSAFNKGDATTPIPYPLYVAKDASGNVQPITMVPSVANGPTPDSRLILFGTGKYMEAADKASIAQQSVYMLYDNNTVTSGDSSPVGSGAISGRGRLRAGTVTSATGVIAVQAFTLGRATTNTDNLTVDTTVRSGWYFDFATSGERQISNAKISVDTATFGSLIPSATAGSSCSASQGGGNQYTVKIAKGDGNATSSTVGIMGEPLLVDLPGATTVTVSGSDGRSTKTITSQVIQQGSLGLATGGSVSNTYAFRRLSWRQINNYQDLKNAP